MQPKLLLLHGALGAANMFEKLKEALKSDFDVYTLNFSGHGGKKFSEEDFSVSLFKNELKLFIQENNLVPVNIFGYSMGGYVALALAKNNPELISSIFTLGTKLNWNKETAAKEMQMLDAGKMEIKIPAFAKQLEQRHQPNDWKKTVLQTSILIENLGIAHLSDDDFITIETKVRLSLGDKDNMVILEETQKTNSLMKNSSVKILPDTFHPLEKLNIQMMSSELKEFFIHT